MLYFSQQKYFPTLEEAKQQIAVLEFKENFPKEGLHWEYKDLCNSKNLLRIILQITYYNHSRTEKII